MQEKLRKLSDVSDLRGKKVLLRLDFNVPIVGNEVRDDFRIKKSLPTLQMLQQAGARTIVISHLESPVTDSLERIVAYIGRSVKIKAFVLNVGAAKGVADKMADGEIIVIENLRKDPGEKDNDPVFAGKLAALADIYVNDAFSVSHREHASMVLVPKLIDSYAGPLLAEEVEQLSKAFNPPKPFLFILGGAKFETKLPLIDRFIKIADFIFVGGALANDIYKEKGYEVGDSLVAKNAINLKHIEASPKLLVPSDVITSSTLSNDVKSPDHVGLGESIMDAGPQTISQLSDLLNEMHFVLWNGPLGDYEKGFSVATENLAKALVASKATTIIGGGDTIAVVSKIGLLDKFSFVSTGGGAMLEFLAKGSLPAIEILKDR